ncbi:MAG: S24 family peptidase, partial [Bacteroidetes bacterium]
NPMYLLSDDETMFMTEGYTPQIAADYSVEYRTQRCVLVPISAQAGYAADWQDEPKPRLQEVIIPGIQDEQARVFEVSGDSMDPILVHGDYVACTRVEKQHYLRDGLLYVVVSQSHGISVKYVRLGQHGLRCYSENEGAFPAFEVRYEDLSELWEVRVRITQHIVAGRFEQQRMVPGNGTSKVEELLTQLLESGGFKGV